MEELVNKLQELEQKQAFIHVLCTQCHAIVAVYLQKQALLCRKCFLSQVERQNSQELSTLKINPHQVLKTLSIQKEKEDVYSQAILLFDELAPFVNIFRQQSLAILESRDVVSQSCRQILSMQIEGRCMIEEGNPLGGYIKMKQGKECLNKKIVEVHREEIQRLNRSIQKIKNDVEKVRTVYQKLLQQNYINFGDKNIEERQLKQKQKQAQMERQKLAQKERQLQKEKQKNRQLKQKKEKEIEIEMDLQKDRPSKQKESQKNNQAQLMERQMKQKQVTVDAVKQLPAETIKDQPLPQKTQLQQELEECQLEFILPEDKVESQPLNAQKVTPLKNFVFQQSHQALSPLSILALSKQRFIVSCKKKSTLLQFNQDQSRQIATDIDVSAMIMAMDGTIVAADVKKKQLFTIDQDHNISYMPYATFMNYDGMILYSDMDADKIKSVNRPNRTVEVFLNLKQLEISKPRGFGILNGYLIITCKMESLIFDLKEINNIDGVKLNKPTGLVVCGQQALICDSENGAIVFLRVDQAGNRRITLQKGTKASSIAYVEDRIFLTNFSNNKVDIYTMK